MEKLSIEARANADGSTTVEIIRRWDDHESCDIYRIRVEDDIPREYQTLIRSVLHELR